MKRLIYIAYYLEVGLVLVLVPWSGFWDRNYFLSSVPDLRTLASNHFVRGAVSGLGVINLCAGLMELSALVSARRIGANPPKAIIGADGGPVE